MNWPVVCAAVIPCFNEAAALGELVLQVRRHLPRVLVVDDGSTDATAGIAREAGATVIVHERNRGKGAALRSGLGEADRSGFAWALLMDGDGQHDPEDIPTLWQAAAGDDVDLVIGNRLQQRGEMPRLRWWVNGWLSRRISRAVGFPCPDSQCGYRLLRLAAWRAVRFECDRYETESELLVGLAAAGGRIRFVPVRSRPGTRASHIRPVSDTWRWFRWWGSRGGGRPGG